MDFGLDNEFESDDSFFDDPKLAKKAQPPKTTEKKSLDDIFGFEEDKKPEKSGQSSLEAAQNSPILKPKVRFNIDDATASEKLSGAGKNKTLDWLGSADDSLGLKTNPKTDSLDDVRSKPDKKSFDLLDDILPQRGRRGDQAKTTSFDDILKDSKLQESRSGPGSLEAPKTAVLSGVGSQRNPSDGLSMILEPPQGPRRGRRGSNTGVTDVLGLFGSGPSSTEFLSGKLSDVDEKKGNAKNLGRDVPDWLGGSSTTLNKSDTTISLHKADAEMLEVRQPPKKLKSQDAANNSVNAEVSKTQDPIENRDNVPENVRASAQVLKPSENIFQANMSNLQTQESFLLVSLQLKKYEENLSEIKNQQQEILRKQEDQFDVFLNKYIEKQKNMEHEMLAQQERINQHIRMMALGGFEVGERKTRNENSDVKEDETSSSDKMVQGLKLRHDEEVFLMEESYKKQIALLEKSSQQVEQRLQQEMENALQTYGEKLENLKVQHKEEIEYLTGKVKSLDDAHKEEIERIKDNHQKIMREAKDEFLDQIERFKEQRNRENELFANSGDLSQKLTFSMEKMDKKEMILDNLQEKVVSDYSVLSMARERSLENKEKEISGMRAALEKCRDQAEKDRSQLLALIRTLEQKISEQNQNSQEERWALQQAAATIAARSVAFDREVEFSRASIEREREQLKTLKETLLAEQEKVALQLTEEKLKLSAEKSRLEVSAKLVNNYEVEKIKTEAETAIQVAKELTEKLHLERNFVQRQKIELESFRNKLMEKERNLLEREENVEEMGRAMQQKSNEDRRLVQETKYLENRYKEKLSELQSQTLSLSNREKKLAEEKLLVSKERLALYTSTKSQGGSKKCMLCKAENETSIKNDLPLSGPQATDPEFIRLRFEAMEDERNSEVSREDNS